MAHIQQKTSSTHDIEAAMAPSSSNAPEGSNQKLSNVRMTNTPPHRVLRDAAQGSGDRASLDIYEMHPTREVAVEYPSQSEQDAKLGQVLKTYLDTEENREPDRGKVLAFVKEQKRQLERPENQRDWGQARCLYMDIFGVDEATMKKIEGGRFSGGWRGAGSLYALSGQLMTFASILPAIYMATVSQEKIKDDPVHYAAINLGAQVGISLATPFVNSAMQILMVIRQEQMRATGQSARSAEMKAPGYPKTDAAIVKLIGEMEKSNDTMEAHENALKNLEPGSTEWTVHRAQVERDGEESLNLVAQMADLDEKYHTRNSVIGLNYAGQLRQSITRALRTAVNLSAMLGATATHNSHIGNYVQVGGTLGTMAIQQFWAGPEDQFAKQNKTLMATIATTRLLDPQAQSKPIDQLTEADLGDLKDLKRQFKGPYSKSVVLGQFKESLELEKAYGEQDMADVLEMDLVSFRRMEALQAKLDEGETLEPAARQEHAALRASAHQVSPVNPEAYEKFTSARDQLKKVKHDLDCIGDNWLQMSTENKKFLYDAVVNDRPWLLSLRTAWVRLRVPADIISQVAQRFGGQFAMIIAGSNMQLIVSALIRYLNASRTADGKEPMVEDNARYVVSVLLAAIGVLGAFSAGPAVNKKITQRTNLRNAIPGVGFQPRETVTALASIGRAMFALPSSAWERVSVQYHASKGRSVADNLRQEVEKVNQYLDEHAEAIGQEVEQAELEDLEDSMGRHDVGSSRHD